MGQHIKIYSLSLSVGSITTGWCKTDRNAACFLVDQDVSPAPCDGDCADSLHLLGLTEHQTYLILTLSFIAKHLSDLLKRPKLKRQERQSAGNQRTTSARQWINWNRLRHSSCWSHRLTCPWTRDRRRLEPLPFLTWRALSLTRHGKSSRSSPTRGSQMASKLNLVCHHPPPTTHSPPSKLFTGDNDSKPLLYDF